MGVVVVYVLLGGEQQFQGGDALFADRAVPVRIVLFEGGQGGIDAVAGGVGGHCVCGAAF